MRSTIFGLALALFTVPALQAQQLATPTPIEEPAPRPAEMPLLNSEVAPIPTRAEAIEVKWESAATDSAREPSARNLFTIIGVVVVVAALIAFLT